VARISQKAGVQRAKMEGAPEKRGLGGFANKQFHVQTGKNKNSFNLYGHGQFPIYG
jgi:hypothetical protein